jgi:hypothetical protein
MSRITVLLTLVFVLCCNTMLLAQGPCGTGVVSEKVVCVIPQLFGPEGLTLPNPFHSAHFNSDFQAAFTPLTAALGSQLTLLPIASPASGITFSFDRTLGVVTRSTESLGPILTERSETIGRHKLFVAFTYQHFGFDTIDGADLHALPAVFTHIDTAPPPLPSPGNPTFERDFITSTNNIDLKVEQFTVFATFGITNRIDASIAVPILDVKMDASSQATIIRNSTASPLFGWAHFFDPNCATTITPIPASVLACQAASTQAPFSNRQSATGIGDIVFRGKATVWKGERAGIAAALDVRVPTGDELNLLGTGAPGVKPFVIASYRARVSPHVNVGYQWNGDSILAGNVITGTKDKLPNQFLYSGGVDIGLGKRLTVSGDILGQHVFDGPRVVRTTYTDILGVNHPDIPQIAVATNSYNITDAAIGGKLGLWRNLVLSGNLLIKLDNGGLRANLVPLVGVSYTF